MASQDTGRPARAPRRYRTNIAIVAAVVMVPLIVAVGFMADQVAPQPAPGVRDGFWPELRGTFDGDAASAEPAARRPHG
jgi:hypothetical protein